MSNFKIQMPKEVQMTKPKRFRTIWRGGDPIHLTFWVLKFICHLNFGRQVPRPALAGWAGSRGTIKMRFHLLAFGSPLRVREAPACGRGASHLAFDFSSFIFLNTTVGYVRPE